MTRHKSRVARRSRRSARRGTRKQSGGFLFGLFGSKPATDAQPAAQPAPDNNQGFFSGILSIFKSKKPEPNPTGAADTNTPPQSPPAQTQPPPAPQTPTVQDGGRKTRHRRRSPRHHRK